MKEVLRKYDSEGLLMDDWEAFKDAWATVVEAIHQEGCAGGMAERGFEFQSAAINDDTLFLVLISNSQNSDDPEGEIYKMIKLGVANVQERVLEKLTTNYGIHKLYYRMHIFILMQKNSIQTICYLILGQRAIS